MSARTHNFRIGLFVLTGFFLLVVALFAMGLKSFFGERDIFETCVTGRVENLSVGALVKLRGVTVGKVTSIEFAGTEYPGQKEQYVLIHFEIPKGSIWKSESGQIQRTLDAEVALGLRARVESQGFLGANIVALEYVDPKLYPVEPIPWTPKHPYIPSAPSQFNRVMTSLEKSLRQVEDLDLVALLDRLNALLDSANRVVQNVNQVNFQRLGTNADALITDFRETSQGLQRTLTDAQGAIKDAQGALAAADVPGLRRDTADLEAKLTAAATELRHVLASVDTKDLNGTLANVQTATDDLIVLLHHLQQQPSSVLFSKPPHPVSEMEKPPKK